MTPLDQCRELLAEAVAALRAGVPGDRTGAILALLDAGDALVFAGDWPRATPPGWNLALRLCLEGDNGGASSPGDLAGWQHWAARFLDASTLAARVELMLDQCAAGSFQLQRLGTGDYAAWPTNRRVHAEQRERDDLSWWSAQLAYGLASRRAALDTDRARIAALLRQDSRPHLDLMGYVVIAPAAGFYRELGTVLLAPLACQHSYPDSAAIGGATFARYGELLALLIGWLHLERDSRSAGAMSAATPVEEEALVSALAAALDADPMAIGTALRHFILDRDNAPYHGAALGQAAPPLIRLDERRLAWSALGLLGEPFIFLARELRRRHAQEYHNSAHLRERVFRDDLYRLFGDRRFVHSPGRVELRRGGAARTDLDALIFDRKTGTLGIFELKAQDPFSRSIEERQRQRDHFFHANRQVSAALEWVQRHGADDLLSRFGERTARQFRVQKVHAFVLGRYLAHFDDGPEPDRRAAWGSWPQALRLAGRVSFGPEERNPLSTLYTRLRDSAAPLTIATDPETIAISNLRLRIFPSFSALRAAEAHVPPAVE